MTAILTGPKEWPSVLLAHAGAADPTDLEAAQKAGAFDGLRRAVRELGPNGTIEEIRASGLMGRGGAGHLTADKWRAAADADGRDKYVVANGYGADPAASTDRTLLEIDPYAVIEGATIAAFAIGAETAYISVRATATAALAALNAALDQAYLHNLVGEDVLGTGRRIDVEIRPVQGAYMLGEETVLL
ncbi:MAG: NADH-quinone oxidoreductase subunit E, partial [Chloroflexota bacterium]